MGSMALVAVIGLVVACLGAAVMLLLGLVAVVLSGCWRERTIAALERAEGDAGHWPIQRRGRFGSGQSWYAPLDVPSALAFQSTREMNYLPIR